jgi:hypothetical protein
MEEGGPSAAVFWFDILRFVVHFFQSLQRIASWSETLSPGREKMALCWLAASVFSSCGHPLSIFSIYDYFWP